MKITSFLPGYKRSLIALGIAAVPVVATIAWLAPNSTEHLNKKIFQKQQSGKCNLTACDTCELRTACQKLKN